MGYNRFLYDLLVRDGNLVLSTPSDYNPMYPVENIRNIWTDYPYRSATGSLTGVNVEFQIKGSASIATTCAAIFGLNLTAAYQTLKWQYWNTSTWVDIGNFVYDSVRKCAIIFYASQSATKFRVSMTDTGNTDNYLQLGAAVVGKYVELSTWYNFGATFDREDTSSRFYSKRGHVNVVSGFERKVRGVTYEVQTADELKLLEVWEKSYCVYPFVFVRDSAVPSTTMEFALFNDKFPEEQLDDYTKRYSLIWEIVK